MARFPKCKYCKEDVTDKTQATKISSGYIHNECIEPMEKEKELNKTDFQKIMDYVHDLYERPNYVMIAKQIKDMKERGLKESGILKTLQYIYEIEEMKVMEDKGIGLVEYKYEDAKNYFMKKAEIRKSVADFDTVGETIVVVRKNGFDEKIMKEPINMEDLI